MTSRLDAAESTEKADPRTEGCIHRTSHCGAYERLKVGVPLVILLSGTSEVRPEHRDYGCHRGGGETVRQRLHERQRTGRPIGRIPAGATGVDLDCTTDEAGEGGL